MSGTKFSLRKLGVFVLFLVLAVRGGGVPVPVVRLESSRFGLGTQQPCYVQRLYSLAVQAR